MAAFSDEVRALKRSYVFAADLADLWLFEVDNILASMPRATIRNQHMNPSPGRNEAVPTNLAFRTTSSSMHFRPRIGKSIRVNCCRHPSAAPPFVDSGCSWPSTPHARRSPVFARAP